MCRQENRGTFEELTDIILGEMRRSRGGQHEKTGGEWVWIVEGLAGFLMQAGENHWKVPSRALTSDFYFLNVSLSDMWTMVWEVARAKMCKLRLSGHTRCGDYRRAAVGMKGQVTKLKRELGRVGSRAHSEFGESGLHMTVSWFE